MIDKGISFAQFYLIHLLFLFSNLAFTDNLLHEFCTEQWTDDVTPAGEIDQSEIQPSFMSEILSTPHVKGFANM